MNGMYQFQPELQECAPPPRQGTQPTVEGRGPRGLGAGSGGTGVLMDGAHAHLSLGMCVCARAHTRRGTYNLGTYTETLQRGTHSGTCHPHHDLHKQMHIVGVFAHTEPCTHVHPPPPHKRIAVECIQNTVGPHTRQRHTDAHSVVHTHRDPQTHLEGGPRGTASVSLADRPKAESPKVLGTKHHALIPLSALLAWPSGPQASWEELHWCGVVDGAPLTQVLVFLVLCHCLRASAAAAAAWRNGALVGPSVQPHSPGPPTQPLAATAASQPSGPARSSLLQCLPGPAPAGHRVSRGTWGKQASRPHGNQASCQTFHSSVRPFIYPSRNYLLSACVMPGTTVIPISQDTLVPVPTSLQIPAHTYTLFGFPMILKLLISYGNPDFCLFGKMGKSDVRPAKLPPRLPEYCRWPRALPSAAAGLCLSWGCLTPPQVGFCVCGRGPQPKQGQPSVAGGPGFTPLI
nr:uncharacterized protein LOC116158322 [Camelus dromedarius]